MENNFKSEKISLVDFDRVIDFFGKLLDEWKDGPSTHMRVANIGVGVPRSASVAREIINEIGSFYELAYAAVYFPKNFSVTADFRHGELSIRCKHTDILESIWKLWEETVRNVEISHDLLKIAIPLESSRFVFSCLNANGRLSDTPEDGLVLERCYYLQYMNEIDMSHILSRFASFLKENQNFDSGWTSEARLSPDRRSGVLPTANALLILNSAGEVEPRSSAAEFLTSRREEQAFWEQREYPKMLVTAIVSLSLIKTGIYDKDIRRILRKIGKLFLEQSQGIKNDAILIDVLKKAGINLGDFDLVVERMEKRNFEDIATPEQAVSALIVFHACGKTKTDHKVKRILDRIIELRNPDGGWPSFEKDERSSLYTTIAALVALKRVNYFGEE